ncbi:hypothetical protein D3C85_1532910 [compost metagenome]
MQERHDPCIRPGFAFSDVLYRGYCANRVAGKYRLGKHDVGKAQVGYGGTQCRVLYSQTNHKAQGENGVDQWLAKFSRFTVFRIDMNLSRVIGCPTKPHVIGLGYSPSNLMFKNLAHAELLKI